MIVALVLLFVALVLLFRMIENLRSRLLLLEELVHRDQIDRLAEHVASLRSPYREPPEREPSMPPPPVDPGPPKTIDS